MNTQTSELDDLRSQRAEISERIIAIERAERERDLSALIGRHFRYRNSYSCPESESDYWWMYSHVTSLRDGNLQAFRFQTDKYGKTEIENGDVWGVSTLGDEIPPAAFRDALAALRDRLVPAIKSHLSGFAP